MTQQTHSRSLAAKQVAGTSVAGCVAEPAVMPFALIYQLAYEAARRMVEAERVRELNRRFGYSLN